MYTTNHRFLCSTANKAAERQTWATQRHLQLNQRIPQRNIKRNRELISCFNFSSSLFYVMQVKWPALLPQKNQRWTSDVNFISFHTVFTQILVIFIKKCRCQIVGQGTEYYILVMLQKYVEKLPAWWRSALSKCFSSFLKVHASACIGTEMLRLNLKLRV